MMWPGRGSWPNVGGGGPGEDGPTPSRERLRQGLPPAGRPALPAGPVLIVEADAFARDALAQLLRGRGYAVAVAADGRQALCRLARPPQPALVLLDPVAPGAEGDFCRPRRRDPRLTRVPVVALSCGTLAPARAAALGVAGQLRKPANPDRLLRLVARWCG
jgi:CheY-like chemotaxis protein